MWVRTNIGPDKGVRVQVVDVTREGKVTTWTVLTPKGRKIARHATELYPLTTEK